MRNTKNVKTIPEVIEYFEKDGFEVSHTLGDSLIDMRKDDVRVFFHARDAGYEFNYEGHKLKNLKTMLRKANEEVTKTNSRKNTEYQIEVLKVKVKKSFELAGISFEGYGNSCEREYIRSVGRSSGRFSNTVNTSISLKDQEMFGECDYSDRLMLKISLTGSKRWTITVQDSDKLSMIQDFINEQEDYFESLSL